MQTYTCSKVLLPDASMRVKRSPVHGVTALETKLFVIRYENKQQLEVYDSSLFRLESFVYIPGLREGPYGLTSCPISSCLYLSDSDQVHTVKLSGDGRSHSVTTWSVTYGNPVGLHLNALSGNLLVTCRGSPCKLLEYTTGASPALVREISLPKDVTRPSHAVQLTCGLVVVVHGRPHEPEPYHRLCTLDDDGTVLYDHIIKGGLTPEDKDEPGQLAATIDGSFIMADCINSRILVMGPSLSRPRELLLKVDGGFRRPYALCLDESRGRMYVGDCTAEGRILVFENVFEIGNGGM